MVMSEETHPTNQTFCPRRKNGCKKDMQPLMVKTSKRDKLKLGTPLPSIERKNVAALGMEW